LPTPTKVTDFSINLGGQQAFRTSLASKNSNNVNGGTGGAVTNASRANCVSAGSLLADNQANQRPQRVKRETNL
jgi:hypothetical protein